MTERFQIKVDTTAAIKRDFQVACVQRGVTMMEAVNALVVAWIADPETTVPFPERIRRAGLSPHPEHPSKPTVSGTAVPNSEQKNSLVSPELQRIESSVQQLPREIRQKVLDLVRALIGAFGSIPEDDLALRIIEGAIRATKEEHEKVLHYRQIARQAMMKAEQEQLKCHRQDVLGGRQIEEYYPSDGYLELLRAEARRAFGDWWTEMSGHGAWRELPEFALRWCAVQACLAILRLDIHSTKALRFVVEHT